MLETGPQTPCPWLPLPASGQTVALVLAPSLPHPNPCPPHRKVPLLHFEENSSETQLNPLWAGEFRTETGNEAAEVACFPRPDSGPRPRSWARPGCPGRGARGPVSPTHSHRLWSRAGQAAADAGTGSVVIPGCALLFPSVRAPVCLSALCRLFVLFLRAGLTVTSCSSSVLSSLGLSYSVKSNLKS